MIFILNAALEKKVNQLTSKKVNKVLHSFQGISKQIPPMFSAKRYKGKRLYSLARNGIKVKREPIKIDIKMIKLLSMEKSKIIFEVECSKGTYIRVLGKDIAHKLDTVGFLYKLERTQIGNYNIENSISINRFIKKWKLLEN